MVIGFAELLEALAAAPVDSEAQAVGGRGDGQVHPRSHAPERRARSAFARPSSKAIPARRCASSFTRDRKEDLPPRLAGARSRICVAQGFGYRYHHETDLAAAGARLEPARSRAGPFDGDEGRREVDLVRRRHGRRAREAARLHRPVPANSFASHDTTAGVYAHASVGCLHVRPVVNMKTEEGVRKFEAIANEVADLVLEFGGALSGEHGDGLVRSPFMRKMFGDVLYEAFREIKRTFDPHGHFQSRQDRGRAAAHVESALRRRLRRRRIRTTLFDYSEYGGMGGAVEMCSGVGACRKKLAGTMCPSYMATREETDTTRGRANVLRLAMTGKLGECRARRRGRLRSARPVSRMPRVQGGVPGGRRHGALQERISRGLLDAPRHAAARACSGQHRATVANWGSRVRAARPTGSPSDAGPLLNEKLFGIDPRRTLPAVAARDFRALGCRKPQATSANATGHSVQRHLHQSLRSRDRHRRGRSSGARRLHASTSSGPGAADVR